jgi:hypothetical protein
LATEAITFQITMRNIIPIGYKIVVTLLCLAASLSAAQSGKFTYLKIGATISITGYPTTEKGAVEIPETIAGFPVKSVGTGAFQNCSLLTSISVPEGVTSIGDSAFRSCSSLVAISLPISVASIGESAFQGCSSLLNFTIPPLVKGSNYGMGKSVFASCSRLQSITFSNGFESIPMETFKQCVSLTNVTFPSSLRDIGDYSFQFCNHLQEIAIPADVRYVGSYAFESCDALENVTISQGVQTLGGYSFSRCVKLQSIMIPASITALGRAFDACSSLISITVDPANETYSSLDNVIFSRDQTVLYCCPVSRTGVYVVPNSVNRIASAAFYGCGRLTEIMLPARLTDLGGSAFANCSSLTRFTVPEGIVSLGIGMFVGCTSLTSFEISSSLTSLGDYTFTYCKALSTIILSPLNQTFTMKDGVLYDRNQAAVVKVPPRKTGVLVIPPGITGFYPGSFIYCEGISHVSFPASVTEIGQGDLDGLAGLKSVSFRGNAPWIHFTFFSKLATDGKIYYFNGMTGFPTPAWEGRTTVNMGNFSEVPLWLLENGLAYNTALGSDQNKDGVSLLMAYALKLNPVQELSSRMPKSMMIGGKLTLTYYSASPEVTYVVEASGDLIHWSTAGVNLSTPDSEGYTTASVEAEDKARYLRLSVAH